MIAAQRVDERDEDPHQGNARRLLQYRYRRQPRLGGDGAAQQRELVEERVVHADRAERADLYRDRAGGLVVLRRRAQLADQRGAGRPQPAQMPPREAVLAVDRELLDAAEFVVHGGEISCLERRVDQPYVAPQFGQRLAGLVGDLARAGRELASFDQELGRAQRQVPRVDAVEQRVGVVAALGERESFGGQLARPVPRTRFRGGDCLPGEQPGAQREILGRRGTDRLGAQRLDGPGRGRIAHPGDHERGRGEDVRPPGVLGQPGRRLAVAEARLDMPGDELGARRVEGQLDAEAVSGSAVRLDGVQRQLGEPGRLVVGERCRGGPGRLPGPPHTVRRRSRGAASFPVAGDLPGAGRAAPGPLQRAGGPLVQRRPQGRGQFVVHRVPDKRVRERQPGAVWGSGQHTRRDGGVEHGGDRRRGKPGHLGQHRRVDPLAEHARRAEQRPHRLAEPAEVGQDQLPQFREFPKPLPESGRAALHQHPHEQRIAAGPRSQPVSQPVDVAIGFREPQPLRDVRSRQPGQPDRPGVAGAQQHGQQAGQGRVRGFPECRDDEQPAARELTRQMAEQQQRGPVGPLQVFQHDEQPALRRGIGQCPAGRGEHHEPRRLRIPAAAQRLFKRAAQHAGQARDRLAHNGPRPQRGHARVIDRETGRHRHAILAGQLRGRRGEPGLPDPGLAADQDQPSGTAGRGDQRGAQLSQLRSPADDRHLHVQKYG